MLKPLAATLALAVLAAPAAFACSCLPCENQPTILDSEYTSGAFVGELLSVRKLVPGDLPPGETFDIPHQYELVHLFKVTRSLKGDMPKYAIVRTASNSAACGATFSFETLNAVAVTKIDDGSLHANSCTQMCWGADKNRAAVTEDTMQTWRDPHSGE